MTRLFRSFCLTLLVASTTLVTTLAFTVVSSTSSTPTTVHTRLHAAAADTTDGGVPLANGSMSFNRVCREWRCKYTGDKATSSSLEAIAALVEEYLPRIATSTSSKSTTVNRLVCGACLDFKLMITVPLADFGAWEAAEFAPESEFLAQLKLIEGVSQVETQTITNMVLL